jgi:MFS family permease
MTVIMGTISLKFSEPLIMRFGPKKILFPSLLLVAAGLIYIAQAPVDASYVVNFLPGFIVMGLGIGPSFPAIMTLAMSASTNEDAGLASGLINTSAQVGGALGLAVLATLSATHSDGLLASGRSNEAALASGYELAFMIGAGCLLLGALLTTTVITATGQSAHAPGGAEAAADGAFADAG